jgi:hypothetical protein
LFTLENGENIEASENHPFLINNEIKNSSELNLGDELYTISGPSKIIDIKDLGNKYCYDLLNVQDISQYWTNNILSHNSFLSSVTTLIKGPVIEQFKSLFNNDCSDKLKAEYKIQLHKDFPCTKINMYMPPQANRAYIVGADPSTGSDGDYQAMTVWDITDTYNIELVASFYENDVPPKFFAYILAKVATLYNKAYIAIENNGVSFATLEYLFREFEYDNLVHMGGNPKTSIGIVSSAERKFDACLNLKTIAEDELRNIYIYDGRIIAEMEKFEKRSRIGKVPTYAASQGHDDLMMSMIWALYVIKPEFIENYYNVNRFGIDKLGNQIPLFVTSTESLNPEDKQFLLELDTNFTNSSNDYEIELNQLEQQIENSQENLMKHFVLEANVSSDNMFNSGLEQENDENDFQFAGFTT